MSRACETQQSWGFSFITFTKPECVSDAKRAINGESLDGHQIHTDHSGKSARGTGGGAFGAPGQGCSHSRGGGDQGFGGGRYEDPEDMDMGGQSVYDRYTGGSDRGNYDNGHEACASTAATQE